MLKDAETRNVPQKIEIREDGQTPHLVGYAAVFNSKSVDLGYFVESIRPGAFKRALAGAPDVRAFLNHNEDLMLGRQKAGTLALEEDDHGLKVDITPPDTQAGRDVVTNVRLGNYDGMSFAFKVHDEGKKKGDSWDVNVTPPFRELLDVDLFDVCVVTFPAYPKTEVGLRSLAEARAAGGDIAGEARRRRLEILELELGQRHAVRAATPFVDLPIDPDREKPYQEADVLPRVQKWASSDGSGDKDKINWKRYREAFFWWDPSDAENYQGYKLKFADVVGGKLVAIARGVFLAAAIMQGARGGVDIPAGDRDAVKAHIARYYAKMRKVFKDDAIVPPWEK